MITSLLIPIIVIVAIIASMIRIIPEYERAIVFRFGRALPEPKGPGIVFLIPMIDKVEARVSVRTITMDIEPQDIITRDNISLKVNAVLYFKVVDTMKAILGVENYLYATSQLAQTHLRSVLGEFTLDDLLTTRENINDTLQNILDKNTDPWGVKVVSVEIKHVDLPAGQQRAMAIQAEAERERRAKIINAEGELQAATRLREAADHMSGNPTTVLLRFLQTVSDISTENNTKVILFPLPIEFMSAFTGKHQKESSQDKPNDA